LQEYRQQLAESRPVRHIRHRIRHLLHPKPRVVRVAASYHHLVRTRLSPGEMLRRFHILCGDLPPDEVPLSPALLVAPPPLPPFTELTFAEIPPSPAPSPTPAITPVDNSSGPPLMAPIVPSGGSPFLPPGTGPGTVSPVAPVVPPVPEPSSFVLLLTGFAGILTYNSRR
jgi:hypothetical protein